MQLTSTDTQRFAKVDRLYEARCQSSHSHAKVFISGASEKRRTRANKFIKKRVCKADAIQMTCEPTEWSGYRLSDAVKHEFNLQELGEIKKF